VQGQKSRKKELNEVLEFVRRLAALQRLKA